MQQELINILEKGAVYAAKALIGWRLYAKDSDNILVGGTIVETEAYTQEDAASHSFNGRTTRNDIMFGPAGHLYVYFTYGMHWCANIVTGREGQGEAVLLRAILPEEGIEIIRSRRGNRLDSELTNGPAKLCQALDITNKDNGADLSKGRFVLLPPIQKHKVRATQRIGITRDTSRLWRFLSA